MPAEFDQSSVSGESWWPLVYEELRWIASKHMSDERRGHTLQTTGLVHEVYLRLAANIPEAGWSNRRQFFGYATEAMRRILVEHARKRLTKKRGGDLKRQELRDMPGPLALPPEDVLAVHDVLDRLIEESPAIAEVVRLRIFCGASLDDVAGILGIARSTVHSRWEYGKARLCAMMNGNVPNSSVEDTS